MKLFIYNSVILLAMSGLALAQESTKTSTTKVLDVEALVKKLNKTLQEQQTSLRQVTAQLAEANLKLEIATERNEDLASELSKDKRSRYSNLESASKAKLTAFAQNTEYLRDRVVNREKQLGKAEAKIASLEAQLSSYKETASTTSGNQYSLNLQAITERLASLEKRDHLLTEALNKFNKAGNTSNLAEDDKSSELKKQLAEVTAKYQALAKETDSKNSQLTGSKKQLAKAQQSITQLQSELKEVSRDAGAVKNLEIKYQVAQNLIEVQKAELLKLKSSKEGTDNVTTNRVTAVATDSKQINLLKQRLLNSQTNLRKLTATNGALVREIDSLKLQLKPKPTPTTDSKNQEHKALIGALQKDLKAKAQQNKALGSTIVNLQSQVKSAQLQKDASKKLTDQIQKLTKKNFELLKSKDQEIKQLRAALDKQGQQLSKEIGLHSNNVQMLSSFRSKHSSLSKQLGIIQNKAKSSQALTAEIKSLKSKLDASEIHNLELKKKITKLEKNLTTQTTSQKGLVRKLNATIEENKNENTKLLTLVSTNKEQAADSSRKLKSIRGELAKVKKERDELSNALNNITSKSSKVKTQFTNLQETKNESDLELVKALAELEDLQKLIRQQDAELVIMSEKVIDRTTTDDEREKHISKLQSQLKKTEETTGGLKLELNTTKEKLQEEQSNYKKTKAELEKVKTSSIEIQQKLKTKENLLAQLRESKNKATKERQATLNSLKEKQDELSQLLQVNSNAITAKETANEQLQVKQKELAKLKQAKDAVVAENSELKKTKLTLLAERDNALKHLKETKSEIKSLRTNETKFSSSIANLTKQLQVASEERKLQLSSIASETDQLRSQLDKAKQALEKEQSNKLKLEKTLAAEQNAKNELSSKLAKTNQETVRLVKLGDTKAIEIASARKNIQQSKAQVKKLETKLTTVESAKQKLQVSIKKMQSDQLAATKIAETKKTELLETIKKSNDGIKQLAEEMTTLRNQIKETTQSLDQEKIKTQKLTAALEEQINLQENTRNILYQIDPIFFASAQDHFDYTQQAIVLNQAKKILEIFPEAKFRVTGHTDNVGDPETNLILSKSRAENFVNYLVANGINTERITHAGIGQNRPIATNDTWEGRSKNRRVEVEVYTD